jgi:hypothetical protein
MLRISKQFVTVSSFVFLFILLATLAGCGNKTDTVNATEIDSSEIGNLYYGYYAILGIYQTPTDSAVSYKYAIENELNPIIFQNDVFESTAISTQNPVYKAENYAREQLIALGIDKEKVDADFQISTLVITIKSESDSDVSCHIIIKNEIELFYRNPDGYIFAIERFVPTNE